MYRLLGASGRDPSWRPSAADGLGPGATFVLVPGAWMGAWIWHAIVEGLRAAGYSARTLTLEGLEPGLTREARGAVDLAQHVEQVARLIEDEDLRDVVLVSHSYSGIVANTDPHQTRPIEEIGLLLLR